MSHLADDVIRAYVDSGEPLDKAGGYGIQALGSSLVKSINGDFYNVEGFPAHRFAVELRKFINL
jgi:septum formation protein